MGLIIVVLTKRYNNSFFKYYAIIKVLIEFNY